MSHEIRSGSIAFSELSRKSLSIGHQLPAPHSISPAPSRNNGKNHDPPKKLFQEDSSERSAIFQKGPLLKRVSRINDSHPCNAERMTRSFLKTAVKNGACMANLSTIKDFRVTDEQVTGVVVKDNLSDEEYAGDKQPLRKPELTFP